METVTRNSRVKTIGLYVVIAIILVGAVVLGLRFAKNRAESYAHTSTPQPSVPAPEQPAAEPVAQQPTPAPTPTPEPAKPASTPTHVPSTGPEELVLPIFALSAFAFCLIQYVQTRRKLSALNFR